MSIPTLLVALVVALLAGLWWHRTRPAGPVAADADSDAATLSQLRSAGADLRKPHATDFFLYLPTEAAAQQVARTLSAKGFTTDVRPAASGTEWLCEATKELVLTPSTLAKLRADFSNQVRPHGGSYDGWGAQVVG